MNIKNGSENMIYVDRKNLFVVTITLTEQGQKIIDALDHFICQEFNITKEELKGEGRYMPLPKARGCFTSILRSNFYFPLKLIGQHLGGRDHSSILMAERRAKEFYKRNEEYRLQFDRVLKAFTKFISEKEGIEINGFKSELAKETEFFSIK